MCAATAACSQQPRPTAASDAGPSGAVSPSDAEASALAARLASLVLQLDDLTVVSPGTPFTPFDVGPLARADLPPSFEEVSSRRLGGWKARYKASDPGASRGILVAESRVERFADAEAAATSLAAYRRQYEQDAAGTEGDIVEGPEIGDEAIRLTLMQPGTPEAVVFHSLAWRTGPFTAQVLISGFEGEVDQDQATELAALVEQRLRAAANSRLER